MIKPGDALQNVVAVALKCKHVKIADDAIYANRVAYMFESQSVITILKQCRCRAWFDVSGYQNPHISIKCPDCRRHAQYLKSPRRYEQKKKAERSCLMCGKKFISAGPHNRRCTKCDLTSEKLGDNVSYKTTKMWI